MTNGPADCSAGQVGSRRPARKIREVGVGARTAQGPQRPHDVDSTTYAGYSHEGLTGPFSEPRPDERFRIQVRYQPDPYFFGCDIAQRLRVARCRSPASAENLTARSALVDLHRVLDQTGDAWFLIVADVGMDICCRTGL